MTSISRTALLAELESIFGNHGYKTAKAQTNWPPVKEILLVAEDEYGVVAVSIFESTTELIERWTEAQGETVELFGNAISHTDAKWWEGYLILISLGQTIGADEKACLDEIRRDTSRIRKFVFTGSDLTSINSISRLVSPLLPMSPDFGASTPSTESVDEFYKEVAGQRIEQQALEVVLETYRKGDSILQSLDTWLHGDSAT